MEFKDATTYKVQFFGKHDYAYVPISNTKIFTSRNPNAPLDEKSQAEIDACMPVSLNWSISLHQNVPLLTHFLFSNRRLSPTLMH